MGDSTVASFTGTSDTPDRRASTPFRLVAAATILAHHDAALPLEPRAPRAARAPRARRGGAELPRARRRSPRVLRPRAGPLRRLRPRLRGSLAREHLRSPRRPPPRHLVGPAPDARERLAPRRLRLPSRRAARAARTAHRGSPLARGDRHARTRRGLRRPRGDGRHLRPARDGAARLGARCWRRRERRAAACSIHRHHVAHAHQPQHHPLAPARRVDALLSPPRANEHVEALRLALRLFDAGRRDALRERFAERLVQERAMREPWFRSLVLELRGRSARSRG